MTYKLDISPKVNATLNVILDVLDDGAWHPVSELHSTAQQATGAAPRTVDNLIRSASAKQLLRYRGKPFAQCEVRGRPQPQITWTCAECRQPIEDGTGYIHIDLAAVMAVETAAHEWTAKHETPEGAIFLTGADLFDYPTAAGWTTHHADCDPHPDSNDYWFDVARARTHAQLLDWTAHLMGKTWLEHTNWANLIRAKAGVDA
jgi:hypothetical protein